MEKVELKVDLVAKRADPVEKKADLVAKKVASKAKRAAPREPRAVKRVVAQTVVWAIAGGQHHQDATVMTFVSNTGTAALITKPFASVKKVEQVARKAVPVVKKEATEAVQRG